MPSVRYRTSAKREDAEINQNPEQTARDDIDRQLRTGGWLRERAAPVPGQSTAYLDMSLKRRERS